MDTGESEGFGEFYIRRNTASLDWKGQSQDETREGCQTSKILKAGKD